MTANHAMQRTRRAFSRWMHWVAEPLSLGYYFAPTAGRSVVRGWDRQDMANTDLHWGAGFGFCQVSGRRDMTKRRLDNVADQELTFLRRIGAIPNRAVIGQTKVG